MGIVRSAHSKIVSRSPQGDGDRAADGGLLPLAGLGPGLPQGTDPGDRAVTVGRGVQPAAGGGGLCASRESRGGGEAGEDDVENSVIISFCNEPLAMI